MKRLLFLLSFIILSVYNVSAQTLTEQQKDSTIAALRSFNPIVLMKATFVIIDYHIYEAIPELEDKIWEKKETSQIDFLNAMVSLNSENAHDFILAFLDTLANKEPSLSDSIDLKIQAIEQLFLLKDFSFADYIFGKLMDTTHSSHQELIDMLYWLTENSPENEERAKNELIFAVRNAKNDDIRSRALIILKVQYGTEEMLPLIIERFKEDEDFGTRLTILKNDFPKFKINLVNQAIREQLLLEPEKLIRQEIARYILDSLGTPFDYKYILDWLKDTRTDIEIKKRIKFEYWTISPFYPQQPDSLSLTTFLLDTLTSYTNQCYGYDWLKDEAYKNELLNKLTNAKTKLSSGDSTDCRTEVAAFQNSVNQVYQDSVGSYPKYVSEEGYKFLYYYAGYILDRLPEPPTVEGLPVNLKDSQGNLLQGGSLKYFDADWHK